MTEFLLVVWLAVAVLCFLNLRLGMCLTLVVGFLQDPLRKIVPDSPVYYSVLVIVFAAITFIGAAQVGSLRPLTAIPGWRSRLQGPFVLFVAIVLLQCVASFLYTGSAVLAAIGILAYLSPFPAVLLGYCLASNLNRVITYLWIYVALSAAAVSGVYLSWLGVGWESLATVGESLWMYPEFGDPIELLPGFMRAPEVAAWHAASGACITLLLGVSKGRKDTGFLSVVLILFFVGAVMLTGRRKFLLEIAMFLPFFWWLLWRFKMATDRILYLLFALALAGAVIMVAGVVESDDRQSFGTPVARTEEDKGRIEEIIDRFQSVTFGAIPYVLARNGFFGSGAGTGSQGSQHFGGGDELIGGAAEGGLGKILAEIGVPGFLAFLWLCFRFSGYVWRTLAFARSNEPEAARLTIGIVAFLAANAIVFITAHQAYGDPFVLLFIGTCVGLILATHRYAETGRVPHALAIRAARSRMQGSMFRSRN